MTIPNSPLPGLPKATLGLSLGQSSSSPGRYTAIKYKRPPRVSLGYYFIVSLAALPYTSHLVSHLVLSPVATNHHTITYRCSERVAWGTLDLLRSMRHFLIELIELFFFPLFAAAKHKY